MHREHALWPSHKFVRLLHKDSAVGAGAAHRLRSLQNVQGAFETPPSTSARPSPFWASGGPAPAQLQQRRREPLRKTKVRE